MRRLIVLIAVVLAILGAGFYYLLPKNLLSSDQQNLVDILGYPDQFVITYLPRNDGQELVRSEVWYYPKAGKQISFLGGKFVTAESFTQTNVAKTSLKPEQFDFESSLSDLSDLLGEKDLEPLDSPEIFSSDAVKTYFSPKALFILE